MIIFLINIIQISATILTIIIIVDVVLSFFMAPYHPLRQTLDSLIEPMLAPVRQILPRTGMLDFSPLVLLILIQVLESVLVQLLASLL
ncbi:MAG: YggT family protein [Anaerolineales bacterium]|nr:YggT family protein [Anaerolineales bacterium]